MAEILGLEAEERIDVGEKGLDEILATQISGGFELVGDACTDKRGHGLIKGLADSDALNPFGFVVDAGCGEGFPI